MSSLAPPDSAGLATLARNGDRELRPVLLLLRTREFVAQLSRDRHTVLAYEALALGLIPLVPDDVVADIAGMLGGAGGVPPAVAALLGERRAALSEGEPLRLAASAEIRKRDVAELAATGRSDIDLALAENTAAALDGAALAGLVERAREDGQLAAALLCRTDLSALDRAALFHAADETVRDRIRQQLERPVATAATSLPILLAERRERLLALAVNQDVPGLFREIGNALKMAAVPEWRLERPAEAELFALALVATGLAPEDCVQVLLTADRTLAVSVPAIFRLAQVCRTTSRPVAAYLVRAGAAVPARPFGAIQPAPSMQTRAKRAEGARAASATDPSHSPRSRGTSDLPGRRSRSTTGRDRS